MDQQKSQQTGFREILAHITPHRNVLLVSGSVADIIAWGVENGCVEEVIRPTQ